MSFKFRAEERQNAPTVKVFISSTLLVWSSHEESVSQCRLITIRALFIHFFNKSFLENRMCRFLLSVEDTDLSTVLVFRHRCLLFQLQAGADRTTAVLRMGANESALTCSRELDAESARQVPIGHPRGPDRADRLCSEPGPAARMSALHLLRFPDSRAPFPWSGAVTMK